MPLKLLTHAEQVALHLRSEMMNGRWRNVLPGVHALSKKLGVNHNTIHAALQLLEEEGLLTGQGRGRPRRITLPSGMTAVKPLRLKILCYESTDRRLPFGGELLARLQGAGFAIDFAQKSLEDLGFRPGSVAEFVKKNPADAWVVISGTREILEWFAEGKAPALALFGRFTGLDMAASGPHKGPALVSATRKLIELGHGRIVMLTRRERRFPYPGPMEQTFLDELEAHGIVAGKFNLPDWDETPGGLRAGLDELFRLTPPTALIISEPSVFLATERYLTQRGITVPGQVSMLCNDFDPVFKWMDPPISHIQWNMDPLINRVIRWATNVARGKEDRRQLTFQAKLVEGGTIGPTQSREW